MPFRSSKTYGHDVGLSACFRQWRAKSHCNMLHGYALSVHIEFEADTLDAHNWVMDFGGLKRVKQYLVDTFDHKTLVAFDDPMRCEFEELHSRGVIDMVMVEATGCEAFSKMIFDTVCNWLSQHPAGERVRVHHVRVREHGANSAAWYGEPNENA